MGLLTESEIPDWVLPSPEIKLIAEFDDQCDHSPNFPPIGNQGAQGSCVGWAVAYYYQTYLQWEEHGWDVSLPAHQSSPAFTYNLINGGMDYGSGFTDAFKVLCDHGCASMEDMPYSQSNYTIFPDESDFTNAIYSRNLQWYYITLNSSGLTSLKNHLLNGHVAVIGISVYANFDNIGSYNNTYCVSQVYGPLRGGHGVTVCGFDDDMVTADGVGAFKLSNSWGGSWGAGGYFWMSYEATLSSIICQGLAYYSEDLIDYEPTVLTRFNLSHTDRYAVLYDFGLGSHTNPTWIKSFFNFTFPRAAIPYPETRVVLDLSECGQYLNQSGSNAFFMCCQDRRPYNGHSGEIVSYSVEELTWPCIGICPDTPVNFPDNPGDVYADLNLEIHYISGQLSGIMTGGTYIVEGDISIEESESLTIYPGSLLRFTGDYEFEVSGYLNATGTVFDSIKFIPDTESGEWQGIKFNDTSSDDGILKYCVVTGSDASGVECVGASPEISHCLISGNSGTSGGGIYCGYSSSPTISDCEISGNQAGSGGGIYCGISSNPPIKSCTVSNNSATLSSGQKGGGICCEISSSPTIDSCFIAFNESAGLGGGVHCGNNSNAIITNCTIAGNSSVDGGGIQISHSTPTILNTVIAGNTGNGGMHFSNSGSVSMTYSDVGDNEGGNLAGTVPPALGQLAAANYNLDSCDVFSNIYLDPLFVDGENGDFNLQEESPLIDAGTLDQNYNDPDDTIGDIGYHYFHQDEIFRHSPDILYCDSAYVGETSTSDFYIVNLLNREITIDSLLCGVSFFTTPDTSFTIGALDSSALPMIFSPVQVGFTYSVSLTFGESVMRLLLVRGVGLGVEVNPEILDFGEICLDSYDTLSFDLVNFVGEDLIVNSMSWDDNSYSIANQSFTVSGFDTAEVEVVFHPIQLGEHTTVLTLYTQSGEETVMLTGTAVADFVDYDSEVPLSWNLQPLWPNPFNAQLTVTFSIPREDFVSLTVWNLLGRKVAALLEERRSPGEYNVVWDAEGCASGLYLIRLSSSQGEFVRKALLLK